MIKRRQTLDDLKAGAKAMHREGQGIWRLELWGPEQCITLVARAMAGDCKAQNVLAQLPHLLAADPPMMCLLCPAEFTEHNMPHHLVTLTAEVDKPKSMLVNGICDACVDRYVSDGAMMKDVMAYYRENMISDIRPIDVHATHGHA